jgi:hypothetical protein
MAMAERKSFLLRIDGKVLDALKKWADDDLRSLNGQIEFILRQTLKDRGRLKAAPNEPPEDEPPGELPR